MNERVQIPGLTPDEVATLVTKRNYAYYCDSVALLQRKECAFCVVDRTKNIVLCENDHWMLWSVPERYRAKHIKDHFLLVTKAHITHVQDLSADQWSGQHKILRFLWDNFKIPGGGYAMRFGDPNLNAGSVNHLHANIIVPDGTGRVQVTLAKEPEETEKQWAIMAVYEKMRQGTPFEKLETADQELVKDRLG